jgi:hypothetical protein
MTLRWIARDYISSHDLTGLLELAVPIFIRKCQRHRRYEWYDPVNKTGGIAKDLGSLQEKLRWRYLCRQCGLYHVDKIAVVVAEDYQTRKYELEELWFTDFLNSWGGAK